MRYRFIIAIAWASLLWERLWPALWPAAGLVAILVALSLLGVWQALPAGFGATALSLYLATLVVALVAGLWGFRFPHRGEVLRWIERRHGLAHRPLAASEDTPATPETPAARALWQRQQERSAAAREQTTAAMPHPRVAARDPWGLRILVALVLIVAVIIGGHRWRDSLNFLLFPPYGYSAPETSVTAWLDPPAYTGERPRTIAAAPSADGDRLTVPDGTTLRVSVAGARRTPVLEMAEDSKALDRKDREDHSTTVTMHESGTYRLTLGTRTLATWPVTVAEDQPPQASFPEKPGVTRRQSLNFHYRVSDDYGVDSAEIRLSRSGTDKVLTLPVSLNGTGGTIEGSMYENLTAHPWAGLTVIARLAATDGAGQTGVSQPISFPLPERQFTHPIAKELIQLRKMLVAGSIDERHISRRLMRLSMSPKRFGEDLVVYLAMRTAAYRVTDDDPEVQDETIDLLWDTALRLEDGGVTMAEEKVREALEELQAALSDKDSSADAISRKIEALKQAMADYMKALAQQPRNRAAAGRPQNAEAEGRQSGSIAGNRRMTPESLSDMMQRIEDLAEVGAKEDAQNLLSELQSFLENMQVAGRNAGQASRMNEARQALSELRRDQQSLMDDTYRQPMEARRGQSQTESGESEALTERQQKLRAGLQQMAEQMQASGSAKSGQKAMKAAGKAMTEAEAALRKGASGRAVQAQAQAIKALSAAEQALAGQQQATGRRGREGQGRGFGDANSRQQVVPTKSELGRAHEILEEIRRRASEWERPEIELDYLNRLLERF